jgi:hypothetical protein
MGNDLYSTERKVMSEQCIFTFNNVQLVGIVNTDICVSYYIHLNSKKFRMLS